MTNLILVRASIDTVLSNDPGFKTDFDKMKIELFRNDTVGQVYDIAFGIGGGGEGPVGIPFPSETVVSIVGDAVLFVSVLLTFIITYLKKNDSREITLEREDKSITIKGHSVPDEKELLEELFPEALNTEILKPGDE